MVDGSRDERAAEERRPADAPGDADDGDSTGNPQPRVPDLGSAAVGSGSDPDGRPPTVSPPGDRTKATATASSRDRPVHSSTDRHSGVDDSRSPTDDSRTGTEDRSGGSERRSPQSARETDESRSPQSARETDESRSDRVSPEDRIPLDPSLETHRAESTPPERDPSPESPGEAPDPQTGRFWAGVLAALAVVSFLTAAIIQRQGPLDAALGAAALGVVFLGVAVVGLRIRPMVLGVLAAGWAEHRRYVGFSAAIFGLGILLGALLGSAGYNVLDIIAEMTGEHPFEGIEDEELTAWWFIRNNSLPFALSIVGAVTLGLLTAYVMVFNGIIVGNVGWFVGGAVGVEFLVVGLTPHGIFELTALFIAAGVGFRLFYRLGQRVLGKRESFVTKRYLVRTTALVVFGWLLLALAAFVEAHLTGLFLETLFDAPEPDTASMNETASAIVAALF